MAMDNTNIRIRLKAFDHRVLDPRHRIFLKELPLQVPGEDPTGLARLVRGDTEFCLQQAMVHMDLAAPEAPLDVTPGSLDSIERF